MTPFGAGDPGKSRLAADGRCRPLAFVLTAGEAGDAPVLTDVMARLRVPAAVDDPAPERNRLGGSGRCVLRCVLGSSRCALVGRVRTFATHAGIAVTAPCPRARYAVGGSPTSSLNRELNEPSDVQPTSMHASVTLVPPRSSAIARSMRRVMR